MMTSSPDTRRRLHIDLETYSSVDIGKCGLYKYVEAPDFQILLLAYAWDDGPVEVQDLYLTNGEVYKGVLAGLLDPEVVKVAHNCAFERACLEKLVGAYMPPEQWEDTMILAAMNGLPMSLDAVGAALNLKDQKIKEGVSLISYFCKPCRPTKANGGRTRNLPTDAPDKWLRFVEYCRRDVEVEQAIHKRLRSYRITPQERAVFALDARINERGVFIDRELAEASVALDAAHRAKYEAELVSLTGLENPNSVSQLKDWLASRGQSMDTLGKAAVADTLRDVSDPVVRRVLELRQLLGKTSTSKYDAMLRAACVDDRTRGITQYYGAGRTGRWAGRLVQLQNLPQNHLDGIGDVRELVRQRDLDTLELCFDSVSDVLSQLIRTAFIAKPGHTFLVADYSAIEARVTAYLAGEKWRQEVFAKGGDIYCASASQMFHVPVEKHGVNAHLRQKGKIAELALGYGGGVGALKAFGAEKMGLVEPEMEQIVTQWRAASPRIPELWRNVENAARRAIKSPGYQFCAVAKSSRTGAGPYMDFGIYFERDADALRCILPSKRVLSYWGAGLDEDDHIYYMGQNQTTRKWERTETWGGKLVENIVQAFARDCLALAMLRLEEAGFRICFHVHDEVICEAPEGSRWEDMAEIMGRSIPWAEGLLLRADGYSTGFYMKD